MGLFDVIGPVMVGPSSLHTAGAVRLGNFARLLLHGEPTEAEIGLHGSFAATGAGHGTELAILAGIMGLAPDDEGIPRARELAARRGLRASFHEEDLGDVHPNSVRIVLRLPASGIIPGEWIATEVCGSSVGGGEILIWRTDGFAVELSGRLPTLLLVYPDHPGVVAVVSGALAAQGLNIAEMKVHRRARGGEALMTVALDQEPTADVVSHLAQLPDMLRVRFVPGLEGGGADGR